VERNRTTAGCVQTSGTIRQHFIRCLTFES